MKKLEKILWSGVYSNDPKKVAFALNLGANINFKSNIDITPLHWAAYKINKELVEILISAGADVNSEMGDTFGYKCNVLHP